jgi:very-short-patch-repair endonuclease
MTMISRAQKLRRNMTDVERKLWNALRRDQIAGLSFRRQHPIGVYVLDFYCPRIRLAIELDGGQHGFVSEAAADRRRTDWLESKGIEIIRFWNNDVTGNPAGVLMEISRLAEIKLGQQEPPSPTLPLSGGGRTGIAS